MFSPHFSIYEPNINSLPLWSLTNAVVADAAVRGSRGSEDLAGVAVLEFDNLVVDLYVADSRRGSLTWWNVSIGRLCREQSTFIVNI